MIEHSTSAQEELIANSLEAQMGRTYSKSGRVLVSYLLMDLRNMFSTESPKRRDKNT